MPESFHRRVLRRNLNRDYCCRMLGHLRLLWGRRLFYVEHDGNADKGGVPENCSPALRRCLSAVPKIAVSVYDKARLPRLCSQLRVRGLEETFPDSS